MVYYSYAGIAIKEAINLVSLNVPSYINYNMYVLQCSRIIEFILKHVLITECDYSKQELHSIHRLAVLLRLLNNKFGNIKSHLGDISVIDNIQEDLSEPSVNFYWTTKEDCEDAISVVKSTVMWYLNNSDITELFKVFQECTGSTLSVTDFTEIPNDNVTHEFGRSRIKAMFKLPFN